jgi:dolichol kinase
MHDEVARRLVHVAGTLVPVSYLAVPAVTWRVVQGFLLVGTAVAVVLEVIRLWIGLDWTIYERLTREYEQDNPAGYALYAVGMSVVALAFPPAVAVPAMLMLTVADPVSGLLSAGELRPVKQGWVLLVVFGLSTLFASFFVSTVAAILGGITAAVADGVKPTVAGYVLDDNFTIPVGAALVMYAGVLYLP